MGVCNTPLRTTNNLFAKGQVTTYPYNCPAITFCNYWGDSSFHSEWQVYSGDISQRSIWRISLNDFLPGADVAPATFIFFMCGAGAPHSHEVPTSEWIHNNHVNPIILRILIQTIDTRSRSSSPPGHHVMNTMFKIRCCIFQQGQVTTCPYCSLASTFYNILSSFDRLRNGIWP